MSLVQSIKSQVVSTSVCSPSILLLQRFGCKDTTKKTAEIANFSGPAASILEKNLRPTVLEG